MLWNIEDVLFSVMISYMGAIEMFFLLKQIIHLAFQHDERQKLTIESESMKQLQERIENEIDEAEKKEILGFKAMKDGILYKDGFRVDTEEIKNYDQIEERQVIGSSTTDSEINKEHHAPLKSVLIDKQEELSHDNYQEVCEEPCIKKVIPTLTSHEKESVTTEAAENERSNIVQTVKTQFRQNDFDQYSSSAEITTSISLNQSALKENLSPLFKPAESIEPPLQIRFDENEREAPDGEDFPQQQYTDDYLRSLDGIKHRPNVRDDGTGRRRAFKKRRSSDSTSSRESRASREEELKVFTSLEEAELESVRHSDSEHIPIKYSSEQNIRIGKHQKRHRKSPVKWGDSEEQKSSLEMLDEEDSNPWGEIKPEHYKETEFWKQEKKLSIQEENENHMSDVPEQSTEDFQHAGEVTTSPSPTKNFPKLSTFEEATQSQNENVVAALERQNTQDKEEENINTDDLDTMGNVSRNSEADSVASVPAMQSAFDDSKNPKTVNYMPTTDQYSDQFEIQNKELTINYISDDKFQYEEHVRQKETELFEATARFSQFLINNLQQTFFTENLHQLTEFEETNITPATDIVDIHTNLSSLGEEVLAGPESPTSNETHASETCNQTDTEINKSKLDPKTKDENRSETPVIEINYAPDEFPTDSNAIRNKGNEKEYAEKELDECSGLIEGISDFYDFNASINPSRSPSTERQFRKSLSPNVSISSIQITPTLVPISAKGVLGLSDFYDYNVMLNKLAYGYYNNRAREAHKSSTDYILDELKHKKVLHESRLHLKISKNGEVFLKEGEDGIGNLKNSKNTFPRRELHFTFKLQPALNRVESEGNREYDNSAIQTPSTPEYRRSFSSQSQYLERLKDEYRNNVFKRSTYVGESTDFSDDFEELREQTRHFRRSGSKSRSPICDRKLISFDNQKKSMQRELQDKILEEITKTTIHYQDFSNDINQKFLEHERRGSDSVLLQKPQIFIEFQNNLSKRENDFEDDELDELEAEEYHHFRRFSLNQEYPVEEYPADYMYIEQIEVQNNTGTHDYHDIGEKGTLNAAYTAQMPYDATLEEEDHAEVEDLDSGSDDERQTVVEVDDEIDEDIWDYERPEDFTEQSECEEAEREMDRYANHNAGDWKENDTEDIINIQREITHNDIEEMYDDAVKSTEEAGIQKDYDTIIEEMNEEEANQNCSSYDFNTISVKTEDILEKILREDEEKYGKWSSSNRDQIRRSRSASFLEEEVTVETSSRVEMSSRISSKRLRSRYGFGLSNSYKTYDNLDNIDVDINYKPKKEYKWRKNFKLDENDSGSMATSISPEVKIETIDDNCDDSSGNLLDVRKYSLGGESITLFTRSPDRKSKMDDILADEQTTECFKSDEEKCRTFVNENKELLNSNQEEFEETPKKKKSKKKSGRVSKDSIEDGETFSAVQSTVDVEDTEIKIGETGAKRKTKKKKKVVINDADILSCSSSPSNLKIDRTLTSDGNKFNSPKTPSPVKSPSSVEQKSTSHLELPEPNPVRSVTSQKIKTEMYSLPTEITSKPKTPERSVSKSPELRQSVGLTEEPSGTNKKPKLERNDSTGVYELIKDGSMYPWF